MCARQTGVQLISPFFRYILLHLENVACDASQLSIRSRCKPQIEAKKASTGSQRERFRLQSEKQDEVVDRLPFQSVAWTLELPA